MSLNGGDSLARGARSAQFSAGGHNKSQLQWDLAVLSEAEFLAKYPSTPRERYLELLAEYERPIGET
jgi:hypothetical protein